jgi:hypothetical protein
MLAKLSLPFHEQLLVYGDGTGRTIAQIRVIAL